MKVGDQVMIHPASDWFMRGVRTGLVTKIGRKYVHVFHVMTDRVYKIPKGDIDNGEQ